jgi:hypothetical protein
MTRPNSALQSKRLAFRFKYNLFTMMIVVAVSAWLMKSFVDQRTRLSSGHAETGFWLDLSDERFFVGKKVVRNDGSFLAFFVELPPPRLPFKPQSAFRFLPEVDRKHHVRFGETEFRFPLNKGQRSWVFVSGDWRMVTLTKAQLAILLSDENGIAFEQFQSVLDEAAL